MEAMVQAGQIPGAQMNPNQMANTNMNMMPNGVMNTNFMNQPPPWIKEQVDAALAAKEKEAASSVLAAEADEMPPGEAAPGTMPPGSMVNYAAMASQQAMGQPPMAGPPAMAGQPPMGQPPMGAQAMPGQQYGQPGYPGWPGWGAWPPPLGPPGSLAPVAQTAPGAATQLPAGGGLPPQLGVPPELTGEAPPHMPPPHKEEVVIPTIPPELIALAGEWTTHRAPDGRPYYFNSDKQESVWEKPQCMKDLEELQTKIALAKGERPPRKNKFDLNIDESTLEAIPPPVIDVDAHDEAVAEAERKAAAERERAEKEKAEREQAERERAEKEKAEKEKAEKEKADKEKAKQDKSRPISSTPISGTPW
ncbi:transcription elongation regulator 1-like isoform X1 [Ostrinia furnacalis]|uniref:transcription elongation regulator 1-like isoform X1 n=1 Tax=Ostrinia furnacalis TaxID=93504 RepID=UPI00103B7D3C|nr:transcription elongation regulator 1-like isoform X1 [Ostrinia furnacalis]